MSDVAKYALVIANNQYSDPGLAQLSAPGQDAEDFARVLQTQEIGSFENVKVLLNQPEAVVREAIDEFFTQKKADDLLVLYFSGHGVRDEQGALYLAVTNTNRARLRSTGIKSDFIRESMDQSRSRRQVLILDCCNSGAFARGSKAALGVTIGTSTAFEGSGYGRVVLTATDSTQYAWEGDKIIGTAQTQNSLFTHFLVKGLEGEADQDGDGKITVDELYDYAYEQIVSRTPMQTPGKWSYKQQGEIVLRQSAVEEIRPAELPDDLKTALDSSYPSFREAALRQLDELMKGKNKALARSARAALERLAAADDSRRVALLAAQMLEPYRKDEREDAEMIARPVEARLNKTPTQAARASEITPGAEIEPAKTHSGLFTALRIALVWSICFLGSGIVVNLANSSSILGDLVKPWMVEALFGAFGGLGTALTLGKIGALKERNSLLLIPVVFGFGLLLTSVIAVSIGNEGGNTSSFVLGYGLGGVVGGGLGGLGVGLLLLKENAIPGWKSALWITACYAVGFGLGLAMLVFFFTPIENQTDTVVAGAVSGAIGGAIAGLISGAGSVYWLRKVKPYLS